MTLMPNYTPHVRYMRNGMSVFLQIDNTHLALVLEIKGGQVEWSTDAISWIVPNKRYHPESWEILFRKMIMEDKGLMIVTPDKRGEYLFISVEESLKLLQRFL